MQVDAGRLKLCVRILGATLKEHGRDIHPHQQSKQRSILSEDTLLKENPYTDLLRRRTFDLLARGDTPETSPKKQFRIIVPVDLSVRELKSLIAIQFRKLYPTEDPLLVRYIREDSVDCDLDDDFLVSDFFTEDSFIVALCETMAGGRMAAIPAPHITACEVIAMPRPLATPMSEMGDILHKELLSASPTPSMVTMSLVPAATGSTTRKGRKRRRREKANIGGAAQDEGPAKKSNANASSTNERSKELLDEPEISCLTNISESQPSPLPMVVSERGEEAFQVGTESAGEPPSEPVSKKSPIKGESKNRFREGLQAQTIAQSSSVQAEKSQSEPAVPVWAPVAGRMNDEEVINLIQATPPSSSSDEDADLSIPVVESRLIAASLRPLVGISPIPASSTSSSSESEEVYTSQLEVGAMATGPCANSAHRTSLTALTEELRRSSAASPIPPFPTKILAPINANGAGKPKRRRQRRRGEITPGPTATSQ